MTSSQERKKTEQDDERNSVSSRNNTISSMLSLRQRNTSSPKVRFNIESTVNTEFDEEDEDQFIEDFMPADEASSTKEKDERARRFSYYRTISEKAKLGYSVHQFGTDMVLEDDVSLLHN